jgi:hypothetical protein
MQRLIRTSLSNFYLQLSSQLTSWVDFLVCKIHVCMYAAFESCSHVSFLALAAAWQEACLEPCVVQHCWPGDVTQTPHNKRQQRCITEAPHPSSFIKPPVQNETLLNTTLLSCEASVCPGYVNILGARRASSTQSGLIFDNAFID